MLNQAENRGDSTGIERISTNSRPRDTRRSVWMRISSLFPTMLCVLVLMNLLNGVQADQFDGDMGCGEHPLKGILANLDSKQPNLSYEQVVRLLGAVRSRYPRLWKSYESALAQYSNCKLMAASGSLG